jgi:hypothetical protein
MIEEGSSLKVECATLPVASFSKFEPQSGMGWSGRALKTKSSTK